MDTATDRFDRITRELNAWAEEKQLMDRALASCGVSLRNAAKEDVEVGRVPLKGWSAEAIKPRFLRHALIFKHEFLSPYLETSLKLSVNDEEIGRYRLITALDGSPDDDYLELFDAGN